jgi:cupin 2 domain-containing protein
MTTFVRGRLWPSTDAPAEGERSEEIARLGGVVVEHTLSGEVAAPLDFDQAHDEWVVVLEGGAVLEVDDKRLELRSGDWVLLPAHLPHRLVETRPGTSWLALHSTD